VSLVRGFTYLVSFTTCDTVDTDTLAILATSLMVTMARLRIAPALLAQPLAQPLAWER
jgi:hypothetical protein